MPTRTKKNEKLESVHSNVSISDKERCDRILKALDDCSSMTKEEFKACVESLSHTNAYAWCRKC